MWSALGLQALSTWKWQFAGMLPSAVAIKNAQLMMTAWCHHSPPSSAQCRLNCSCNTFPQTETYMQSGHLAIMCCCTASGNGKRSRSAMVLGVQPCQCGPGAIVPLTTCQRAWNPAGCRGGFENWGGYVGATATGGGETPGHPNQELPGRAGQSVLQSSRPALSSQEHG